MSNLVVEVRQWLNQRFPKLFLYIYILPQGFLYRRKHPVRRLLKGKLDLKGSNQSCLFFSVHKSATSFLSNYLAELADACGLTHIDYNGYFFTMGRASLPKQRDSHLLKKVFHPQNFLYGPLRYYLPIRNLEKYRIVLFLRDPRDVLTSHYFSVRNTHPLNTLRMIKKREAAKNSTIDEFVCLHAERFLKTYTDYCEFLLEHDNVLFLRYEDMIVNFKGFVREITRHIGVELTVQQLVELDRSNEFNNKQEDFSAHKRKIVAGDHREKLRPETIEWLNTKFETVLKRLGYN